MGETDPFEQLDAELIAWRQANTTATFWWRDDDAGETSPGLAQLLDLADRRGVICALATVPAWLTDDLAGLVRVNPAVEVIQHGYAHINHAPRGQGLGAWELGLHRSLNTVMSELREGRDILRDRMDNRFLPVVAAPWNRIDPALFSPMVEAGFVGVSAADARTKPYQVPGLLEVNGHCDPIKWRGGARFKGAEKTVRDMVEHLVARRTGAADRGEPTGLLTHHRDTDDACWQFLDDLIGQIKCHPAARWLAPSEIWT
ncbi:MAG: polysaccharide deacetylase family protein [Pseudomonadota bacterium]